MSSRVYPGCLSNKGTSTNLPIPPLDIWFLEYRWIDLQGHEIPMVRKYSIFELMSLLHADTDSTWGSWFNWTELYCAMRSRCGHDEWGKILANSYPPWPRNREHWTHTRTERRYSLPRTINWITQGQKCFSRWNLLVSLSAYELQPKRTSNIIWNQS